MTGGSRGIGRAIAEQMAASGAKVMIASRKAETLAAVADAIDGEVLWHAAHAGDPAAAAACVDDCVARLGGIDILVNNAATNPYMGPTIDIDVARAEKTVQVNQMGVLYWSQAAWRASMRDSGGVIVNMASIGGLAVEPAIGWYNVTKAAVIHLTRHLASELGPGVRVNAIAPGLVKTDFARSLWEGAGDLVAARLPLKRLGEANDVAKLAVFLASDASAWMTGSTVVVDGGALLGQHGIG